MIYTTGTIAINGNAVTGTGTDFSAPLSLIRVGCTLIAIGNPVQIFTITEIKSGTELSVTPAANPAIPAGTKFSILLSDSISVDGLAQDVAETLRYYQSKETEVAEALEWSQNHIGDKIGLGKTYRDCPDISGDPSNYVGFTRIIDTAAGFPSIASGEWCLTGWIAQANDDGSGIKTYLGVFVGHTTKSLYCYNYVTGTGTRWVKQLKSGDSATFSDVAIDGVLNANETHTTAAHIHSDNRSRKLRMMAANSPTNDCAITLWGSDSLPSALEFKTLVPGTETTHKLLYQCQVNSDGTVQLAVNGAVTCTTVSQSSDRDLKDNIQVIGDATEAIRKMNGYTYTLKENGLPYAGVIAQEVMEALPEAVGSFTHYGKALQGQIVDGNELREETRYLNVDYAAVTGLLVQVARETDNRVTELEEENASLRDNITAMDERIAKLEALVSKLTGSEK